MTDAELMKDTREQLGLSQAKMAAKLGYNSRTAIAGVEGGATGLSNVARSYLRYIREQELNLV